MRGDFSIWRDERRQNFNGVLTSRDVCCSTPTGMRKS